MENEIEADDLRQIIERLETLDEEKSAVSDRMKEIMDEAKETGYEPKIIRKVLRIRKRARAEHEAEQTLLEVYLNAVESAS